MYQISHVSLKHSVDSFLCYLQRDNTLSDIDNKYYAYSSQNYLYIYNIYENEYSQPASQYITAIQEFSLKGKSYLAIGTQNEYLKASVLIFDYEFSIIVCSIPISSACAAIAPFSDGCILVGVKEYIYCYQISASKTQQAYKEMFWTQSADNVQQIYWVNRDVFVCFCSDMYLRLYEREELKDEIRTLPRNSLIDLSIFGNYIAVAIYAGRSRLYYIDDEGIQFLCQIDDINYICGKFVKGFSLVFKPFSYPLKYYMQSEDLYPFQKEFIERSLKLQYPVPLLMLFLTDGSYAFIMFDLIKNEQFYLKLTPEVILTQEVSVSKYLTLKSTSIYGADQFLSFQKLYLDYMNTNYITEQMESLFDSFCHTILCVYDYFDVVYFVFHPYIDFLAFFEYICDNNQDIYKKVKNKKKTVAEKDDVDNTGISKKKMKKVRKVKKQALSNEESNLIELFKLRSIVAEKMIENQTDQQLNSNEFEKIAKKCIENIRIQPTYGGFRIECLDGDYKINSAAIYIENQRYNLFSSGKERDNNEKLELYGLGKPIIQQSQRNVYYYYSSPDYHSLSFEQKQVFHGYECISLVQNVPRISSQSENEIIITYYYQRYNMNIKSQIETSLLPYFRVQKMQNIAHCDVLDGSWSSITFSEIGIEQLLQFLQCCFIDYAFQILNDEYTKIADLLMDSHKENVEILGDDYNDYFGGLCQNSSNEVKIRFSRNTKDLQFISQNFKSLLVIAYVCQRSLKLAAPQCAMGTTYRALVEREKNEIKELLRQQEEIYQQSAEISQNLMFSTGEIIEKCQQKQLNNVLFGYDVIAQRSVLYIVSKIDNYQQIKKISQQFFELQDLGGFFSKEVADLFVFDSK